MIELAKVGAVARRAWLKPPFHPARADRNTDFTSAARADTGGKHPLPSVARTRRALSSAFIRSLP